MPVPTQQSVKPTGLQAFISSHPTAIYFTATFTISWGGALAVTLITLLRSGTLSKMAGLIMFPAMLVGPCLTSIVLTRVTGGRTALNDLFLRMRTFRVPYWYACLLIPPSLIFIVLVSLKTFISPAYAPNRFLIGATFGVMAGFFEEIGWMGFAFPMMVSAQRTPLGAAVTIGLLWGVWHLPVIDYLGTATPHGSFLSPFFFTFVVAMTAMRILIAWMYTNTNSVLLAQLMHASSTGSLVALSPSQVTPAQEAIWYGVYACGLWLAVGIVVFGYGARLSVGVEKSTDLRAGGSGPERAGL